MTCVPIKERLQNLTPIGDRWQLTEDRWMLFVPAFISTCIQANIYPRTDSNSRQATDYSVHAGPLNRPQKTSNQENLWFSVMKQSYTNNQQKCSVNMSKRRMVNRRLRTKMRRQGKLYFCRNAPGWLFCLVAQTSVFLIQVAEKQTYKPMSLKRFSSF